MKIKEIKIENFGKLKDFQMNFDDQIAVIKEENGWGKSTLAAFIRVMFFGFDGETLRDEIKNERRRFKPWDGGTYGGSLAFEKDGKEYRIVRIFGSKAKDDEFYLYDNRTKLVNTDYSENIGEELFGLDSGSFRKTVFVDQNDIETDVTDGISAKLGNLMGVTDDIDNYNDVAQKLNDKLNSLSLTKKTGALNKLQAEITSLESELRRIPVLETSIRAKAEAAAKLKEQLENIKKEKSKLEQSLQAASKEAALLSKKKHYESLEKELSERLAAKEAAQAVFAKGLPSEKDLYAASSDSEKLASLAMDAAEKKPTAAELDLAKKYETCFASGVPSAEELDVLSEILSEAEDAEKSCIALQFSEQEQSDFDRLSEKFRGQDVFMTKIDVIINGFDKAKSKKETLSYKEAMLEGLKAQDAKPSKSALWIVLLIFGIVLAGAAAYLYLEIAKTAGLISAFFAGALVISGIVIKLSAKPREGENTASDKLAEEIENEKKLIETAEQLVKNCFAEFAIPFDYTTAYENLLALKAEYLRLQSLIEKKDDQRDDKLREKADSAYSEIDAFLNKFDAALDFESGRKGKLEKLRYESQKYSAAKEKIKAFELAKNNYESKKAPLVEYVKSLGFDANDPAAALSKISALYEKYKDAALEYAAAKRSLEQFEKENNAAQIKAAGSFSEGNLDDINEKIRDASTLVDSVLTQIHESDSQLQALLEERDRLSEKEERLVEVKERFEYLSKREFLLRKTKDLLEKSKAEFVGKYCVPITSGFNKYYRLIEGKDASQYSFDANLKLLIEDHGSNKDLQFYSAGSRDKIGLCFRMALIDAMYKTEKPVIIMDDPFTNLDESRISGGMKALDVLKNDFQLIYLTCHDSRKPR